MSTNCVFPPELEDKQLMAYLDDPDANQDVARHLKQCPHCSEKAETLKFFLQRLTQRLYRSECPSSMELGEYHLRLLPDPQRLMMAQHVRECRYCARELAELEGFLSDLSPKPGLLEPIRVLIAQLVSSGTEVAVRGEVPTTQVFQVDDIVISLESRRMPNGEISIEGFIADQNQSQWKGATIELRQAHLTPLISSVDEFGGFSFTEISTGLTQVTITSLSGIMVQTEKMNLAD